MNVLTLPGRELEPRDLDKLALSGISPELAARAMLRRVTSAEGADIVGRNGSGNYAGIAFPYFWPDDIHVREYRLRRDQPEIEYKDGQARERGKYLSPPGRGNMFYFAPNTLAEWLADRSMPLMMTEGEKKC